MIRSICGVVCATLTFALSGGSSPLFGQQEPGVPPVARQMLPVSVSSGLTVRAARLPEGRSVLRIANRGEVASVQLPHAMTTAATGIGDDLLVAGVLPDGAWEYRSLTLHDGTWTVAEHGVRTFLCHVAKMSCKHGRLALLLGDGTIVSAPCDDVSDLPSWGEFEYVGMAPPQIRMAVGLAHFHVAALDRISIYAHPMPPRPAFVRQASGEWLFVQGEAPPAVDILRVEKPARIGSNIRFGNTTSGPVFLEEEGVQPWMPVTDEQPSAGWGLLPSGLSQGLRADTRYRLQANGKAGAWFYPAAIAGSVWFAQGLRLEEIRVLESGVRAERGSIALRTTLEFDRESVPSRIHKAAFVAVSASAQPPIAIRGGRTWLVADQALSAEKQLQPRRQVYALSVAVPLPEGQTQAGRWVHAQLLVIGEDGAVLGATGVRSVAILPNQGDRTVAQEQAGRVAARGYWAAHGIQDVQQFWDRVVEPR